MSVYTTRRRRLCWEARTTVSLVAAVGATAATLMIGPPPAHAADRYFALAVGFVNDELPLLTAGGSGISGDETTAARLSMTNCSGNGADHCAAQVIAKNECAAAASNDYGDRAGATGATVAAAQHAAISLLGDREGAHVIVWGCANSPSILVPPSRSI